MRKIAIVGPESSGKTTLAEALASVLGTVWVAEAAREYLARLGRPYQERDLLSIAEFQVQMEEVMEDALDNDPPQIVICDTDMITIRIWSEEKFGRCDPWIIGQSEKRHYDVWLLCAPDIPWEPDPLRENPHDRDRLFQVYKDMLDRLRKPYVIVSGSREERLRSALKVIGASSGE